MNVLEKILEEIKQYTKDVYECDIDDIVEYQRRNREDKCTYIVQGIEEATEFIRSHMNHSGDDAEMGDWISVEERLPEEDDGKRYIVTDEHGLVRSEMEYGHPMDGNREVCFHKWDDEYWSCYRPKVIAWQPLPEPYKPKQD